MAADAAAMQDRPKDQQLRGPVAARRNDESTDTLMDEGTSHREPSRSYESGEIGRASSHHRSIQYDDPHRHHRHYRRHHNNRRNTLCRRHLRNHFSMYSNGSSSNSDQTIVLDMIDCINGHAPYFFHAMKQ